MATTNELPYCDLIMKGGITSGIIYPRLVAKLAERYRFKNIGGSSAGAIGAGAAAAAEYGRLHGVSNAFEALNDLPTKLGDRSKGGRSKLFHLFQPAASLTRHFAVLQAALNAEGKSKTAAAFFWGMVGCFWLPMALSLLVGLLLLGAALLGIGGGNLGEAFALAAVGILIWWVGVRVGRTSLGLGCNLACAVFLALVLGVALTFAMFWIGLGFWKGVAAVLATAVIAVISMAVGSALAALQFVATFSAGVANNKLGICSGMPDTNGNQSAEEHESLTQWLHRLYNELAGLPSDKVLTFGDLWGCEDPASPVSRELALDEAGKRVINLEMMTTALSQRIPYRLPFRRNVMKLVYYDQDEWRNLFPDAVWKHIVEFSRQSTFVKHPVKKTFLWHFPAPADLPVVVAVRMSLSFPVLLSAIPAYSVDWTRKEIVERRDERRRRRQAGEAAPPVEATRVWFSDGGIASNLPLHFFDSKLPSHPTFAIDLKSFHLDEQPAPGASSGYETGRVSLPDDNQEGLWRHWTATSEKQGLASLVDFLWTIVETMQVWRDEIQFTYPGYRDRIAQISQKDDEGGLNLDMPDNNIKALGNAGENAARKLIERFLSEAPGTDQDGWLNHQTLRIRTLLGQLETMYLEIAAADRKNPRWREILNDLKTYKFSTKAQEHISLSTKVLDQIGDSDKTFKDYAETGVSLTKDAPRPVPELRISPRI